MDRVKINLKVEWDRKLICFLQWQRGEKREGNEGKKREREKVA